MTLTPNDYAVLVTMVLVGIGVVVAWRDDQRWWRWARPKLRRAARSTATRLQPRILWANTVGAYFAKRRAQIRLPKPDEHSSGIMVARRDINTGNWS